MIRPEQRTHERISPVLCGRAAQLLPGRALVRLDTTVQMAADERGLVHGGFTFGLAHYAAVLAVNEPTVVLSHAEVKFLGPVVAGDRLEAEAEVERSERDRRWVKVVVRRREKTILEGQFTAVILEEHVIDIATRAERSS